LVGSRNGKRIDHLVTYPADNLLPVPAAAIQVGDQGAELCERFSRDVMP
jgi:hypothetical protein